MQKRLWIVGLVLVASIIGGSVAVQNARGQSEKKEVASAMASGQNAYHTTRSSYELPTGDTMLFLNFDGVQFNDQSNLPGDRAHQTCHATCLVSGSLLPASRAKCRGYCAAVDAEGDVWWIQWDRLKEGGGTWSYLGGTGKYEGVKGGGDWTAEGLQGPNIVSNSWRRTW
jgi:hypothetical protein